MIRRMNFIFPGKGFSTVGAMAAVRRRQMSSIHGTDNTALNRSV
jgi:hypothetical protein